MKIMVIRVNEQPMYDLAYHFSGARTDMRPLYDKLIEEIADLNFGYKISKTYIGLTQPLVFACVRVQNKKLIFEFTSSKNLKSPRFKRVLKFQKNRWAYFLDINSIHDIDAELLAWIKLSYENP